MRKILIMVLIAILLAGLVLVTTQGVVLGSVRIPSIREIILNNQNLENGIASLQSRINGEYKQIQSNLATEEKKLQDAKQSYQDKITYSTEEELQNANNIDKYEIGYLWTKLGVYAKKYDLELQADLSSTGNTLQDKDDKEKADLALMCDLSVTVQGEYLSVSEFIYAIENDKDLGFRIREFSLVPYSENELQGKFKITNVGVNKNTLSNSVNTVSATSDTDNINNTGDTTNNDSNNNE